MDADLKKLKKLTKFMRDNGILSVKTAEIEMSLAPQALFPVEQQAQTQESTQEMPQMQQLSDEEILLWSSPGHHPEIQEAN